MKTASVYPCFARIYRIYTDLGIDSYVGSTKKSLDERKTCHLCESRAGKKRYKVYEYFREHGEQHMFIESLEEFWCIDRDHQRIMERHWSDRLRPTLNSIQPFLDDDEQKEQQQAIAKRNYEINPEVTKQRHCEYSATYRENNPDKTKEGWQNYYEINKETLNAKSREYYHNHKEELAEPARERSRAYNAANKESIAEKRKAYREANKEKIKEQKRLSYLRNQEGILARRKAKKSSM